jgi:hypothetical protein
MAKAISHGAEQVDWQVRRDIKIPPITGAGPSVATLPISS